MRALALGMALAAATALAPPARATTPASRDAYGASVVGLSVTYQDWDEDRPWAKRNPSARSASGVVVPGPYILVAAQMLADATLIRVEKFGRPTQAVPRIAFADPEVDLALLAVDDPGFFEGLAPVRLAPASPVEGTLRTVRWQDQQIESAASRVKRFRVAESFFGRLEHVFVELQTDLSGGGWSEPVFQDGRLVGLAISQQKDQRALAIPIEIIAEFLRRAREPASYSPFPVFGAKWQVNEDRALARYLGQTGEPTGIVVRQVPWGGSACGVLQPRDILLSIDGVAIDGEGYYADPRFGQVRFANLLAGSHTAGDRVPVEVLRDGRVLDLEMTLRPYPVGDDLIPARRGDEPPPYLVAGGLVFRELDADYLRSWGPDWPRKAPPHLVTRYVLDQEAQSPERRRIVLLSAVLPSEYNVGYQDLSDLPVARVNGRPIDSIPDVADALAHPEDGFDIIELEPNSQRARIVLDAAGLEAATAAILESYGIPAASRMPASPPPDPGPPCPGTF